LAGGTGGIWLDKIEFLTLSETPKVSSARFYERLRHAFSQGPCDLMPAGVAAAIPQKWLPVAPPCIAAQL